MQHKIPIVESDPASRSMASAVESCVHCGFCLPTCPTYQELGEEMDSPRGRIYLMKEVLEGGLTAREAAPYIDRCLGCLGCVTACPSGVAYDELVTLYRARSENTRGRGLSSKMLRRIILTTLPSPRLFRIAMQVSKLFTPFRKMIPGSFGAMLDLVPKHLPPAVKLPEFVAAEGRRRGRVALLAGCAQQVLAPEINLATLRVLSKNGIEVVVPVEQGCCGALAAHTGAGEIARQQASHNIKVFPDDVDAVITNAAGCGSGLKEYPLWLADREEHAQEFAARAIDISQYLSKIGLIRPPALARSMRVAYHDACHLSHGQGVRNAPREILAQIQGVEVVAIKDSDICCGSAGTYSIEQPGIARRMGQRKAQAIIEADAEIIAMGNIGCMTQVENHLRKLGSNIPVKHTIEILDAAYQS